MSQRTKHEKVCLECGKLFHPWSSATRFCSLQCVGRDHSKKQPRRKRRRKTRRSGEERKCLTCGKSFHPVSTRPGHYCSLECVWHRKRPQLTLPERFWPKVQKSEDCWLWIAGVNSKGYGVVALPRVRGQKHKRLLAPRASWLLHFGDIPEGSEICHKCDNPRCVRPDHLFMGSHQDNLKDASRKGRTGPQRHPLLYFGHSRRKRH